MRHSESYQNIDISKEFKAIKMLYRPKVKEISILSIIKATKLKKKDFINRFPISEKRDLERVINGEIAFYAQLWPALCLIIDEYFICKKVSLFTIVRIIYGLSQADLALSLAVNQGTISNAEKAHHSPSSEFALKFIIGFNVAPIGLRYILDDLESKK